MIMEEERERHTCLKLLIPRNSHSNVDAEPIFVKGTWFPTHFHLAITDGLAAWYCRASEEEVKQRASQWDQPVSEYLHLSERYLELHQPGSVYAFDDAGDGHKRLSWTFEKEGVPLLWRWKCLLSPNCKETTAQILDFLMDSNIKLNFLGVLNSKKSKLRELRDKLSKQENAEKSPQEEDTEKTESFDEESDNDKSDEDPQKDITSSTKDVMANKPSRRKRTRHT
ncbi:DNA repair protein XRCC4-like isoform X2 [Abrus precatorius]|uniref:DNA repair protein XRCC4-like isoform X2 n=1 Tax=Abrus precatorius TaxID=3816 RepID=A0A8B8MEP9_ABRPR|nr:DNA repair protein XRCC4-like isoform X2 [Abrus precatorius]